MKRSTQVLLSLVLGFASCGCSGIPDAAKLDAEGKVFATKVVDEQKSHWDAEALQKNFPASSISITDLRNLVQKYSEGLGEPTSTTAFDGTYKVGAGINVPDYVGEYKAELTCTKGKGTVNVSVVHKDGKWYLTNFNVVSADLAPKDKELQSFVDDVADKISCNWRIEDLNYYGSELFKKQLKESELPMKAMFAGAKALGPFKSVKSSKFLGIGQYQGAETFSYELTSVFERGEASMMITAIKEEQKWKLAGFHVQAHSGKRKP